MADTARIRTRSALALVGVLACLSGVGAAGWYVMAGLADRTSTLRLAAIAALFVLAVVLVNALLLALDNWLDRTTSGTAPVGDSKIQGSRAPSRGSQVGGFRGNVP